MQPSDKKPTQWGRNATKPKEQRNSGVLPMAALAISAFAATLLINPNNNNNDEIASPKRPTIVEKLAVDPTDYVTTPGMNDNIIREALRVYPDMDLRHSLARGKFNDCVVTYQNGPGVVGVGVGNPSRVDSRCRQYQQLLETNGLTNG